MEKSWIKSQKAGKQVLDTQCIYNSMHWIVRLGKDLNVYTGTHQILEYEGKKLYLQNDKRFIPVPKYYWTVVVDEVRFMERKCIWDFCF